MDSRFVVPHVVPLRGRRFHLIYLMHNLHVGPPRRWDSEVSPVYKRALSRIDGLDAMVTLTERQRDDIAERHGRTSNLFVVPNPVTHARAARRARRRATRSRVTIVARLEPQKRLERRDRGVPSRSSTAVPGARLDIYGDGSEGPALAGRDRALRARRLGHAARLRPAGARGAVDVERVPDDERVRGLSAVDAREHEPRLPGRELRHQVRPARADHRRRRRLPRARGRHRAARAARDRAAALARARAPDERGRARAGRSATGRPSSWRAGRASCRRRSTHKPLRTQIDDVEPRAEPAARSSARTRSAGCCSARPDVRARPRRRPTARSSSAGTLRRSTAAAARRGSTTVELELAWVDARERRGDRSCRSASSSAEDEVPPARDRRAARRATPGCGSALTWRNSAWETDVVRLEGGVLSRPAED